MWWSPFGLAWASVTDSLVFLEREFGLRKLDVKLRKAETLTNFLRPYLVRRNGRQGICRYERDHRVEGSEEPLAMVAKKAGPGMAQPLEVDLELWHINCYRSNTALCYHLRWPGESSGNCSKLAVENFSANRSEVETFSHSHRLLSVENDRV